MLWCDASVNLTYIYICICINREKVMNGANALYVNAKFAAYVLYMRVNSHVICKIESEVFCSSRE